ncbi:MAG: glycosyltransferase [Rhodocyclaceae bacterium]|nr:glycosyltransferase [Rhodocyclaceae bacterium]
MAAAINAPVQMLWVGGPLSALERLSLTSWLANGHEVHLYTYGKPANSPKGLRICDAAEILPTQPGTQNSASGLEPIRFSDMFSYALLHTHGGIWADIDVVCLRPLDFAAGMEYFFASEMLPAQAGDGDKLRIRTSGCVMKAPVGSPLMKDCLDQARTAAATGAGATTGPLLLHGAVEKYNMTAALLNPNLFCPVPFWNMTALISGMAVLPPESYGVHLWNESWRRSLFDRNADYDPLSLYERLKTHYLGRKGTSHA